MSELILGQARKLKPSSIFEQHDFEDLELCSFGDDTTVHEPQWVFEQHDETTVSESMCEYKEITEWLREKLITNNKAMKPSV